MANRSDRHLSNLSNCQGAKPVRLIRGRCADFPSWPGVQHGAPSRGRIHDRNRISAIRAATLRTGLGPYMPVRIHFAPARSPFERRDPSFNRAQRPIRVGCPRSIKDLAAHVEKGILNFHRFAKMEDEEIIVDLTRVHGIGRWTAEMFLIFNLRRPDVLPVDDLGVRNAARRLYRMRTMPDAKRLRALAERWLPYRSAASWYLWRSGDIVLRTTSGPSAQPQRRRLSARVDPSSHRRIRRRRMPF